MGSIVVAVVAFEGVVVPKVVHMVAVLHVVLLVVVVHLVLQAPLGLHCQRFVLEGCSEAEELDCRSLEFC